LARTSRADRQRAISLKRYHATGRRFRADASREGGRRPSLSRRESPRERRNPCQRLPQGVAQQNEQIWHQSSRRRRTIGNVITRECREIARAVVALSTALATTPASRSYPLAEPLPCRRRPLTSRPFRPSLNAFGPSFPASRATTWISSPRRSRFPPTRYAACSMLAYAPSTPRS